MDKDSTAEVLPLEDCEMGQVVALSMLKTFMVLRPLRGMLSICASPGILENVFPAIFECRDPGRKAH